MYKLLFKNLTNMKMSTKQNPTIKYLLSFCVTIILCVLGMGCHEEMLSSPSGGYEGGGYDSDDYHFRYVNNTWSNIVIHAFGEGAPIRDFYVNKKDVSLYESYEYGNDVDQPQNMIFSWGSGIDSVVVVILDSNKSLIYTDTGSPTNKNILIESDWIYNEGIPASQIYNTLWQRDHVYTYEFTQEHIDKAK